ARRLDHHSVTLFLADDGAGDRSTDRELAVLDVRLVLTNDLVGHLIAGFGVFKVHGGAEDHLARVGNGGNVDHYRVLQAAFDIADTRLDHALFFTGSVV